MNKVISLLMIVLATGCTPRYDNEPNLTPLEEYKLMNEWVELDDSDKSIVPFLKIGGDTMTYAKALAKHGVPAYEFCDTVIRGNNIKTDLPDYDLYPLTMERDDTVYVRRCWWFLSYRYLKYLYLVFEEHTDSLPAIYGYIY